MPPPGEATSRIEILDLGKARVRCETREKRCLSRRRGTQPTTTDNLNNDVRPLHLPHRRLRRQALRQVPRRPRAPRGFHPRPRRGRG